MTVAPLLVLVLLSVYDAVFTSSYIVPVSEKRTKVLSTTLRCTSNSNTAIGSVADCKWRERFEKKSKSDGKPLLHIELVPEDSSFLGPLGLRQIAPIAKVGIRPDCASSDSMDRLIRDKFQLDDSIEGSFRVGLFVCMWVDPKRRGDKLGLELLRRAKNKFLENKFEYILIVHDDNGSGDLIRYYKRCGFVEIFDFLEKGMIARLADLNLT